MQRMGAKMNLLSLCFPVESTRASPGPEPYGESPPYWKTTICVRELCLTLDYFRHSFQMLYFELFMFFEMEATRLFSCSTWPATILIRFWWTSVVMKLELHSVFWFKRWDCTLCQHSYLSICSTHVHCQHHTLLCAAATNTEFSIPYSHLTQHDYHFPIPLMLSHLLNILKMTFLVETIWWPEDILKRKWWSLGKTSIFRAVKP